MQHLFESFPTLFLLLQEAPAAAPAETAPVAAPGIPWQPLVAVGFIFYFLLIRPESKKRKQHDKFLSNLSKGDKVMTNSGILGTVAEVREDVVTLQVADKVRMRFVRGAIQGAVDPDEKKTEEDSAPEESDPAS